jgi:hypothetical protein
MISALTYAQLSAFAYSTVRGDEKKVNPGQSNFSRLFVIVITVTQKRRYEGRVPRWGRRSSELKALRHAIVIGVTGRVW